MDPINILDNIIVTNLKEIRVENGSVMHALREDENSFKSFGEAYFSYIDFECIKAWKKHKLMHMNLVVPIGNVKFVFYDQNKSKFRTEIIGKKNYSRLTVPKDIYFGFKGLDRPTNLILNIASILHDPNEVESKPIDFIKYDW